MQALLWIVRLVILLLIVWFATKNADPVRINGLLDQSWHAPLIFVLLVVFAAGMVIGLLAWVPTIVRQRREIARLRKAARQLAAMPVPPVVPEAPSIPEPPPSEAHGL
jgi:putative membrane protein